MLLYRNGGLSCGVDMAPTIPRQCQQPTNRCDSAKGLVGLAFKNRLQVVDPVPARRRVNWSGRIEEVSLRIGPRSSYQHLARGERFRITLTICHLNYARDSFCNFIPLKTLSVTISDPAWATLRGFQITHTVYLPYTYRFKKRSA